MAEPLACPNAPAGVSPSRGGALGGVSPGEDYLRAQIPDSGRLTELLASRFPRREVK